MIFKCIIFFILVVLSSCELKLEKCSWKHTGGESIGHMMLNKSNNSFITNDYIYIGGIKRGRIIKRKYNRLFVKSLKSDKIGEYTLIGCNDGYYNWFLFFF